MTELKSDFQIVTMKGVVQAGWSSAQKRGKKESGRK
jgi:hypothetical protein